MRLLPPLVCLLALLALAASRSVMVKTKRGPVTITETTSTKVIPGGYSKEYYRETAWSSDAKEALSGSKTSEMSMGDLGGSLVIAIDQTAVSKHLKKFLLQAVSKFPTGTKGMRVAFLQYTDHASTIVSLKSGWSFSKVLKRVEHELAAKKTTKKGTKVYDYVGMQAAYNQLQMYGKSTAPRIVLLLTSGSDASPSKSNEWRQKFREAWVSLAEVHINTVTETYHVEGGDGHSGSKKEEGHGGLLSGLLKTYAEGTIQYYKKIYGEVWEFYIVLKYYKKKYPSSWKDHLKAWFKKKFGSISKFSVYLGRTVSKGGGSVSPELAMRLHFKKKYGAKWERHFHMWKLKKQYGAKWRIYWEQHLLKKKYGSRWIVKWQEQVFKKKYGSKWRPHYQKWYYKTYRGRHWRISWKKWSYWQKYGNTRKYFRKFMEWYFKNVSKAGMKGYKEWLRQNKKTSKKVLMKRFYWLYYRLVYDNKKAVQKYYQWLFEEKYGKSYKPKYLAWLTALKTKGGWRKLYTILMLKEKYGAKWRLHWHKTSVIVHPAAWYRQKYGLRWRFYYTRDLYKKKYGKRWLIKFNLWVRTVWRRIKIKGWKINGWAKKWYKKKYGRKWRFYYFRALYQRRYGKHWQLKFRFWTRKHWRKSGGKSLIISHGSKGAGSRVSKAKRFRGRSLKLSTNMKVKRSGKKLTFGK